MYSIGGALGSIIYAEFIWVIRRIVGLLYHRGDKLKEKFYALAGAHSCNFYFLEKKNLYNMYKDIVFL